MEYNKKKNLMGWLCLALFLVVLFLGAKVFAATDSTKIEGAANIIDVYIRSVDANYGISSGMWITSSYHGLICPLNVADSIGAGKTMDSCRYYFYSYNISTAGTISVYRGWKTGVPEGEGAGYTCAEVGGASLTKCDCDTANEYLWGKSGADSANDNGSLNACGGAGGADRKATAEMTSVTINDTAWHSVTLYADAAQSWYDGNDEVAVMIGNGTVDVYIRSSDDYNHRSYFVFYYHDAGAGESNRRRLMLRE